MGRLVFFERIDFFVQLVDGVFKVFVLFVQGFYVFVDGDTASGGDGGAERGKNRGVVVPDQHDGGGGH